MPTPSTLIHKVRRQVQAVAYGSPLYQMVLNQGEVPERLRLTVTDPWPGDARAGQALIAAQPGLFEAETNRLLASHDWLRDLRAVGTESARRKAQALLEDWLAHKDQWQESSWSPEILGERLANWVGFYEFYAVQVPLEFRHRLLASMTRQWRHLQRIVPSACWGVDHLRVLKGLIYAGLALPEGEKALGLALELLQRQLAAEILPDGGHISRSPAQHLHMVRGLIDIRLALRAARLEVPHALSMALERMVPVLKLYRLGDGGLALFHGGREESALWIEAALTLAETRGRVLRRLPQTGYERVTAGRSLLLVDTAPPPPRPYDARAHAGLLAFEFSVGRDRLIVNCGAGPADSAEWRCALASTAAHSTLTLDDTNACELRPEGGIGQRPKILTAQRYEQDGAHCIEACHDGYAAFRTQVRRRLSLAADGETLRGEETLIGLASGRPYALRWHLHPSVQVALVQDGQAALLRTATGSGWRLRLDRGALELESSLYYGVSAPRRTLQLKASGRMLEGETVVGWMLTREKKG